MDAKLAGPLCECGDPFCSGCEEAVQEECRAAAEPTREGKGPNRNGIMDHVLTCGSCNYQTNVVGDLTRHRKEHHR